MVQNMKNDIIHIVEWKYVRIDADMAIELREVKIFTYVLLFNNSIMYMRNFSGEI